jgi:hypothetical protein
MREAIPEIFEAAALLSRATDAHLAGDHSVAEEYIRSANMPKVRAWTESLWGSKAANPNQNQYHRFRALADSPPILPSANRIPARMPSPTDMVLLIERDGRNCTFCEIPLIREKVRIEFNRSYPDASPWGRSNETQHAAFQCMWLQFDHVLPHSRGGDNSLGNILVTCAPCNYGRGERTLGELGLIDPRAHSKHKTPWDGLERILEKGRL